jgi:hypothetical protein
MTVNKDKQAKKQQEGRRKIAQSFSSSLSLSDQFNHYDGWSLQVPWDSG